MKSTKLIICINRAVALGYISRSTANAIITSIMIIDKQGDAR